MEISPLLYVGVVVVHISILVILNQSGGGPLSSSKDDRATQVDSTGPTPINMLLLICNRCSSHLIITLYHEPS